MKERSFYVENELCLDYNKNQSEIFQDQRYAYFTLQPIH